MNITDQMIKLLGTQLALARTESFEGTELFKAVMDAIEFEDAPDTNKAHKEICALADSLAGGSDE